MPRLPRLNELVTVEQLSRAPDGAGGSVETWAAVGRPIFAEIVPVAGREAPDAGRKAALQTWLVTVRHGADITAADRLDWGGRKLHLSSMPTDRDGGRQWLTMEAEEGRIQ